MKSDDKRLKTLTACLLVMFFFIKFNILHGQSIRDQRFRDIDGNAVDLNAYRGKKMLFIVLPLTGTDTLVGQLKNFTAANINKIQVIGVVAQEEGYQPDKNAALKAAYQNTGILLTAGMGSRKGTGQDSLMQWLTDKKKNGHFDMDVRGAGQKFFVNSTGVLYAVFGPEVPLSAPFISKVVNGAETIDRPGANKDKINP